MEVTLYNDLIGRQFNADTFNCYTLLCEVYRRNGILIPDTNISVCACKAASNAEIDKNIKAFWEKITGPEHPCAIIILSSQSGYADHIAAGIGGGRMIHVTADRACVVDRISSYAKKIKGIYRYVSNCHND